MTSIECYELYELNKKFFSKVFWSWFYGYYKLTRKNHVDATD